MAQIEVESEVQGNVWQVHAAVGDRVNAGDILVILESMKMEIPVEAPEAGTVIALRVAPEQAIGEGDIVAVLET